MNMDKKRCEMLKINKGSQLSYDFKTGEYVITVNGKGGFSIPGDCDFGTHHIFKRNSGDVVCRIERN